MGSRWLVLFKDTDRQALRAIEQQSNSWFLLAAVMIVAIQGKSNVGVLAETVQERGS